MRKLIASAFVSLDGVLQAPGGPDEDPSGGFGLGGWTFNFWGEVMGRNMNGLDGKDRELVLGRRTYDIFEAHWPYQPAGDETARTLDAARKHVASRTLKTVQWQNAPLLGTDVPGAVAGAQSAARSQPADHRQRRPDPVAAGHSADRRIQRVDLSRCAGPRQAAVRARRAALRDEAAALAGVHHRRGDEHVCAGR